MWRVLQPRWLLLCYWFTVIALTLVLYPSSTLDGHTIVIILVLVGAFTLGAMFAARTPRALPASQPTILLDRRLIFRTAMIGGAANLCAALLALRSGNLSLLDILTLKGLLGSANSISVTRYESPTGGSPLIALLLGVAYVAALVAPFIRLTDAKRKLWIAVFPAATALLYASVTTERLGFLIAFALTGGGLIAASVFECGRTPNARFKNIVVTCLAACLVAGSFVGIGVLRTGRVDAQIVNVILDKQITYSLGGTGAFTTWYKEYEQGLNQPLGLGTGSVAGVEILTGQDRLATRAYHEFAVTDSEGRMSNVYTFFRGLLMDFGTVGALLMMFLLGVLFELVYRAAARGSIAAASTLGFAYETIFLSAWLATTTFSNVLAVAFVAPIILSQALTLGSRREAKESPGRAPPYR